MLHVMRPVQRCGQHQRKGPRHAHPAHTRGTAAAAAAVVVVRTGRSVPGVVVLGLGTMRGGVHAPVVGYTKHNIR